MLETEIKNVITLDRKLKGTELSGKDLNGADLSGLDLSCSGLVDVDFSGADLRETNFSRGTFTRCDFTGARLSMADMNRSLFDHCVFDGADLRHAVLGLAKLKCSSFIETDLSFVQAPRIFSYRCRIENSSLTHANLDHSSFISTKFCGSDFSRALVHQTDISDSDFSRTCLDHVHMKNVRFVRVVPDGKYMKAISIKDYPDIFSIFRPRIVYTDTHMAIDDYFNKLEHWEKFGPKIFKNNEEAEIWWDKHGAEILYITGC